MIGWSSDWLADVSIYMSLWYISPCMCKLIKWLLQWLIGCLIERYWLIKRLTIKFIDWWINCGNSWSFIGWLMDLSLKEWSKEISLNLSHITSRYRALARLTSHSYPAIREPHIADTGFKHFEFFLISAELNS